MDNFKSSEVDVIDEEKLNEDIYESDYCDNIAQYLNPYNNSNSLPFSLYIKESIPVILEGLAELERLRPKNPVEFFSVFLLHKTKDLQSS